MEAKEKAYNLAMKFDKDGDTDNAIQCAIITCDEILDNTNECSSRYRTDYDRVCIRQYWLEVKKELIILKTPK